MVAHQHHALAGVWTVQGVVCENSQAELFIRLRDPGMRVLANVNFDRCRSDKFVVCVLVHRHHNSTGFGCENVIKAYHEIKSVVVCEGHTLCWV